MSALYDAAAIRQVFIDAAAADGPFIQGLVEDMWTDEYLRRVFDLAAPLIAARALRDFAENHVHHQSPARMEEDLNERAAEIERGDA